MLFSEVNVDDQEKKRLVESIYRNSSTNSKLRENWVGNLTYLNDKLGDNSLKSFHRSFEGLFWIRLYGVLVEFGDTYSILDNLFPGLTKIEILSTYHPGPDGKKAISFAFEMRDLLKSLRSSITEDELISIDNFRHTNCHILQTGYQLGIKEKKGETLLKENYNVATIPKVMNVVEIDQRLTNEIKKYQGDMLEMAYSISGRVKDDAEKLYQTYKSYNRI